MRFQHSLSFLLTTLLALPVAAEETVVVFDPPQTQVHWTLDTVFHTVHGTFSLRSGTVRFDPATGNASGELVVDARSGQSGNDSRDSRMHHVILESPKFPDVVFKPDRVQGAIPAQGKATLQVHGVFELRGTGHEMTLPIEVDMEPGKVSAVSHFSVPYISWGLKNPSTLFLRVNDKVDIEIQATGRVTGKGGH